MQRTRFIYSLLSIGAIGVFFGHAMWAIDGKDTFVELFRGSFDHALGVTVSTDTATDWVKGIGWFDVLISIVLLIMLIGNVQAKGKLYEFAYSPWALAVYSWAVFWGFVTAASRMTAVGEFSPELWDVVERAPNFMLPAALIYLVYTHGVGDRTRPTATPPKATTAA